MLTTLIAVVSLAAIPGTRGVDHQVVVGGPGTLAYNPSTVVCRRLLTHISQAHSPGARMLLLEIL